MNNLRLNTLLALTTACGQGRSAEVTEVPTSLLSLSQRSDGTSTDQDVTVTVTARSDHGSTAGCPRSGVLPC